MGIVRKENRMANEAYLNKLIDSFINNGQIPSEKISTYAEEQTGSSVFASDEKINYTSSPFFEYNSSQEDELTTFSTAHTTDTITENAVNLFTNYTISKGCGDIQNCPKELLELFNNKIDMIENAFKELSGKNLSENEILEKLNEVIKNALNQDTEFLEKIFSDLKDNPQELEKILNSKIIREHILLIATLRNLEKLNRIFSLYETIKTIENVKEKLNIIHNIFAKFLKQKFEGDFTDDLNEIYIISQYLMESNQLVLFEHYFSDEFKVGQFLPIMLPIIYGFIKAFKATAF